DAAPEVVARAEGKRLAVEQDLDLALEEEERLLEGVVVLLDGAAGDVPKGHQHERTCSELAVDEQAYRSAAHVCGRSREDVVARRREPRDVEVTPAVGGVGLRARGLGEDGVLERRAGRRRAHLQPAGRLGASIRELVPDTDLDPEVVVRRKLLPVPGDLDLERARKHVERLLEGVHVSFDPSTRRKLEVRQRLVGRSGGAINEWLPGE